MLGKGEQGRSYWGPQKKKIGSLEWDFFRAKKGESAPQYWERPVSIVRESASHRKRTIKKTGSPDTK